MENRALKMTLLLLSLIGVGASILVGETKFGIFVVLMICSITLLLFYRHIPELIDTEKNSPQSRTISTITVSSVVLLFVCAFMVQGIERGGIGEQWEEFFAVLLILFLLIFLGNLAPKIPFNRYTGLRLPWTVRDEDTWVIAHRILGYLSFPLALIFIVLMASGCSLGPVAGGVILTWIGVPGLISLWYFYRKYTGRL